MLNKHKDKQHTIPKSGSTRNIWKVILTQSRIHGLQKRSASFANFSVIFIN